VRKMARALNVVGLMNTQFAIQGDTVYVLEVNPRASRTVPFVSKATGRPLAMVAARCMAGKTLAEQGVVNEIIPDFYSVKEAVFPFNKFPGVDPLLGPEMKSTGEVMGVGRSFGEAYAKSQLGAGVALPRSGKVFLSVRDTDKDGSIEVARQLLELGFELFATHGTARVLIAAGLPVQVVNKVAEGRPHVVDKIKNDEINLIVNTTEGSQAIADSATIRSNALQHKVTYTTTLAGGLALCTALRETDLSEINCLQDLHKEISA